MQSSISQEVIWGPRDGRVLAKTTQHVRTDRKPSLDSWSRDFSLVPSGNYSLVYGGLSYQMQKILFVGSQL